MDTNFDEPKDGGDDFRESLGDFLRRHREASGKNLDEVARRTRISKRYLEAFENNDYRRFPEEAFARGFLRAYSLEISIEPEESLLLYERLKRSLAPTQIKEMKKPAKFVMLGEEAAKLRSNRTFWGAVAGVILLLVGVGIAAYFSQSSSTDDTVIEETAAVVEEGPTPADTAAMAKEGAEEAAAAEKAGEKPGEKSGEKAAEKPVEKKEATALATPVTPSVLSIKAIRGAKFSLRLDENPLQELTLKEGDVQTFNVTREIEIRSSDKTALQYTYNGKPLEVAGPVIKLFNRNLFLKKTSP